jgi:predicted XRE-type DNA-binding protein
MKTRAPHLLEIELTRFIAESELSQEAIASAAGVSQASVSRASRPMGRKRTSKELIQLCKYAKITFVEPVSKPNPRDHEVLMGALVEAWDGTEEHALGLARVISEVGRLRLPLQ